MNSTTTRKVSVIVPTRDRPALLRGALASIRALEGPDLVFEILVADNGRDPNTPRVVEEFGALYIRVAKLGASAARNAGLRAATGDYLAFLDDDDVWLPGTLRPHMGLLDSNPALDAVIGQVIYTDPHLIPSAPPYPQDPGAGNLLLKRMLSGFFPQIGTALARMRVRCEIGEFDETLLGGEDLDWLLRIARRGQLGFVATPCILFRGRASGSSDALQRRRITYDRRVFFRHGLRAWYLWKSPLDFSRAYAGTLIHFFRYFVDAATERAGRGDRRAALRAIADAFRVLPLRALYHLIASRPLRKAFLDCIVPWRLKVSTAKLAADK